MNRRRRALFYVSFCGLLLYAALHITSSRVAEDVVDGEVKAGFEKPDVSGVPPVSEDLNDRTKLEIKDAEGGPDEETEPISRNHEDEDDVALPSTPGTTDKESSSSSSITLHSSHRRRYVPTCNDVMCVYGPGLMPISLPFRHFWVQLKEHIALQGDFDVEVEIRRRDDPAVKGEILNGVDKDERTVIYQAAKGGKYKISPKAIVAGREHAGPVISVDIVLDTTSAARSFDKFMEAYAPSPKLASLVDRYFKAWPRKSITPEEFSVLPPKKVPKPIEITIINNTMFCTEPIPHKNRWYNVYFQKFLPSLLRKVRIPDVQFRVSIEDFPRAPKENHVVIFAPCRDESMYDDVLIPTPFFVRTWMSGGHVRMSSPEQNWQDRLGKVYFRGINSGHHRGIKVGPDDGGRFIAAQEALKREEIFDVKVKIKYAMDAGDIKRVTDNGLTYQKAVPETLAKKYKYLLNIDGYVAAYRLALLLATGSVVIKQDSRWTEWWYPIAKHGEHFVPVKNDFSDLVKVTDTIVTNDEEAQKIAMTGYNFFVENLQLEDLYGYWALLLKRMSETIEFTPAINPSMMQTPGTP